MADGDNLKLFIVITGSGATQDVDNTFAGVCEVRLDISTIILL